MWIVYGLASMFMVAAGLRLTDMSSRLVAFGAAACFFFASLINITG